MKKIFTLISIASMALSASAVDYTEGLLLLNEGSWGSTPGMLNFIDLQGNVSYKVYQAENEGYCLGHTSDFAQAFGNYVLVCSKQDFALEDRSGSRLVVMDAHTLKYVAQISDLNGADGRSICGVNASKAYVGTSGGVYVLDLNTFTLGTTNISISDAQVGDMVRYGHRVFVAQDGVGVIAIDTNDDSVVGSIEMPNIVGLTVTADGALYAANENADAEFVAIDTETLDTTDIDIEGSHAMSAYSLWGAWHKPGLAADRDANIIYYICQEGWTPTQVASYNFDTREFNETFITLPDQETFYGEGVSVDPATGKILLAATEQGWGTHYANNWLHFVDPANPVITEANTIALETAYWFPSQFVYNHFSAPEVSLEPITVNVDDTEALDLIAATTLTAGNKHLVVYDLAVADATVAEIADGGIRGIAEGTTTLSVTADFGGRCSTATVAVTVVDPNGIADVTIDANAPVDVYTTTGVRVLQGATAEQIRSLAPGLYIAGSRKIVIR